MENISVVTVLTLSGFGFTLPQRATLFLLTLLWYLLILVGNSILIVCVAVDRSLREPMYMFVANLCINSLYGTMGFYPKFLLDLLSDQVISYAACMLQGFVIHSSVCCDFSILALMAYDRYLAICKPLVYHTVMTRHRMWVFMVLSWVVPLCCMFMNTASLLGLRLCGSVVDRMYCVNWMVARLTCTVSVANVAVGYVNIIFYFGHFVVILWSYMYMVRNSLSSAESRSKFMQTCLPHLISLVTFTTTVLLDLLYMRFGSARLSKDFSNFMAIEFLLILPVANPMIYGLKLTKVRRRIQSFVLLNRKG